MWTAYLCLLLLAGCVSPEQIAQRQELPQQERPLEPAYRAQLISSCESIGYERNTYPWRQCIMQLQTQNQQQATALGAALLQGSEKQPRPQCWRLLTAAQAEYARSQGLCY